MTGPLDIGSVGDPAAGDAATSSSGSPARRFDPGRLLAVLFAVASVGLATWITIRYLNRPAVESLDRLTYWRCLNVDVCGKDFRMSIAEYFDTIAEGPPSGVIPKLTLAELNAQAMCGLSPDMPLWCPHCGSYTISRGTLCPHCGEVVRVGAHGVMPDVCASCGKNPGRSPVEAAPQPAPQPDA